MAKHPKPEADMAKIDAREAAHRAAFEAAGGSTSPLLFAIITFFSEFRAKPRYELFADVLKQIEALHLMYLPEHRHGVAGCIQGVVSLMEKAEVTALKAHQALIKSAHELQAPAEDTMDLRPGHVNFLWGYWLVRRELAVLNRIVRFATNHPKLEVRNEAVVLLRAHAGLPEVAECLAALRVIAGAPELGQGPRGSTIPRAQVTALNRQLNETLGDAIRDVVMVGWMAGDKGGFLIVTINGNRPKGSPETWDQRPVHVRKATTEELLAHRALMAAKDDP